jgi:murein L,D-transpeptidase YafK
MLAKMVALSLIAAAAQSGPADLIVVEKGDRRMTLYRAGEAVGIYRIALGFNPIGDKEKQGDGRTPEGRYVIDAKNPQSRFHLSLRVSYPDSGDRKDAVDKGLDPGGDIYIHGMPDSWGWASPFHVMHDWTLGCIAVTNEEIEEIWQLVPVGTPIEIKP